MNITTKFNLGDLFHVIAKQQVYRDDDCKTCQTTKLVELGGESFPCPKCGGNGKVRTQFYGAWLPADWGIVGHIEIKVITVDEHIYDDENPDDLPDGSVLAVERLMGTPTRSGSIYYAHHCFPSREAAQAECDKRNADLKPWRVGA